jgi:hypothetical protein
MGKSTLTTTVISKQYVCLLVLVCLFSKSFSQERFLDISINHNQFYKNDTIAINAEYVDDYNQKTNGTLYVKIINDSATQSWDYRWPILNGISSPKILIPATISNGIYHIYFAARDEQFSIKGTLLNATNKDQLEAVLYNKETMVATSDIAINYDKTFVYTNPYFINTAILHFKNTLRKERRPNIKIQAALDSTFVPTANKYVYIKVGNIVQASINESLPKKFNEVSQFLGKKIIKMETAVVKATSKDKAKKLIDKNISETFKDRGEKTLNLYDDQPELYGQDLFNYLLNNVPGLSSNRNDENSDVFLTLRGRAVNFYLDNSPLLPDFISTINIADIGIIKIFQPPFPLNDDAQTAAIALFRKDDPSPNNIKSTFVVKGYNAPVVRLNPNGSQW